MVVANRDMMQSELRRQRREKQRALNEPPVRSLLEEIGNAVTHGIGALLSVVALVLMLVHATTKLQVIAASIYGSCLILLFTMSCLYHAFRQGTRVKRLWRRFDYCSIYLLIGGSFTPLFLLLLEGPLGLWLCLGQWAVIITGITFIGVFGPAALKKMHYTLYIVLGWSALLLLPRIWHIDQTLFWFLLTGGIAYTFGLIPFAKRTRGAHFLWHLFVLAGAATQWVGIWSALFRNSH